MLTKHFDLYLTGGCLLLIALLLSPAAFAQIEPLHLVWTPREELNILLPASVRIYEADGRLPDGAPLHAVYATIDLRDTNLRLHAVGSDTRRETTVETYARHRAIFAVNGGYFSANKSESIVVSDGSLIAAGPTRFTRGAFAITNKKPEVVWPFAIDSSGVILQLTKPVDVQRDQKILTAKSTLSWHPSQAIGGGPVLIKDGEIRASAIDEGFGGSHLLRHPRTAIGYRDDKILVVVVVDGRQEKSGGVTITELAQMMSELGCFEAVNLDGGGSSTMVAAGEVVNIPVDIPNGNRNSLRRNASAWILSEEIPSAKKEITLIDTDSRHYSETGIWKSSNLPNHYGKSPSREALSNAQNKAVYKLHSIEEGNFQLAAWWPVNEKNTPDAVYVVHHGTETDSIHVNQTSPLTSGKWNLLGHYRLNDRDFIEMTGLRGGKLQTDAIRLVPDGDVQQPVRGDLRVAVISDLNSGLGSATYEWQVDSILRRIPRSWQPDLVICGGDMVAGMGVSDTSVLKKMWRGFDEHIATPLRDSRIPFAFTIGNHDGLRRLSAEREALATYWNNPLHATGLDFIDKRQFPDYYSFRAGDCYFVSWDASSSEITRENLDWLDEQFKSPAAKKARFRFVVGHLPLYSVAQERDSKGDQLADGDSLRKLLEQYDVKTYISGHQHAYYPGKRGKLQLLNCGAAGSGARRWLSTDHDPVNTITLMDIFYASDTIVYTTYDIRQREAKDMTVFDHRDLPAYISSVNGFLIRNDVDVMPQAHGNFYRTNDPGTGKTAGSVEAVVKDNMLSIRGTIDTGDKRGKDKYVIGLYHGRHTEAGVLMAGIPVSTRDRRRGVFQASIPMRDGMAETLSAGGIFVLIHGEPSPTGDQGQEPASTPLAAERASRDEERTGRLKNPVWRAQLYTAQNRPPVAPVITSHQSKNIYGIRNSKGLYRFSWTRARDDDGDFVSYTYQLASDSLFRDMLINSSTGRTNQFRKRESELFDLINRKSPSGALTFYQRVVATDGLHVVSGDPVPVRLVQSQEPLTDLVEVDPPQYRSDGRIAGAEGQGSGALWDNDGKLWMADYGGTLYIKNQDERSAHFSPLRSVTVNGRSYSLKPINGIGLDRDGNILLGCNRFLLKLDARTGEGIAAWEVPEGKRAITSPRVNDKGEIYAMSLFADDPNYVLKQSASVSGTFELLRTIILPERILARTFNMRDDGLMLFFPDPGSPVIQTFTSKDGINYTRGADITSVAAGCNALVIQGTTLFAAVRASGVSGSTLHMRDDAAQEMWTAALAEPDGAEARGIAVSPDRETVVICCWDKGGGFYRYRKIK